MSSGQTRDIVPDSDYEYSNVQWSPDGKLLSFSSFRGQRLRREWKHYIADAKNIDSSLREVGEGHRLVWTDVNTVLMSMTNPRVIALTFSWIDVRSMKELKRKESPSPYSCNDFTILLPESIICEDGTETPNYDDITMLDLSSGKKVRLVEGASDPSIVK
jgi:dipeptidyl aminopeptidase/acylaminoacyl peptidase